MFYIYKLKTGNPSPLWRRGEGIGYLEDWLREGRAMRFLLRKGGRVPLWEGCGQQWKRKYFILISFMVCQVCFEFDAFFYKLKILDIKKYKTLKYYNRISLISFEI